MMELVRVPLEEQETTFIFTGGEQEVEGYTCEPGWIKKFQKLAAECPEVRLEYPDKYGVKCFFPRSFIRLKPPAKRELTAEQRQAIADRLRRGRSTASE